MVGSAPVMFVAGEGMGEEIDIGELGRSREFGLWVCFLGEKLRRRGGRGDGLGLSKVVSVMVGDRVLEVLLVRVREDASLGQRRSRKELPVDAVPWL